MTLSRAGEFELYRRIAAEELAVGEENAHGRSRRRYHVERAQHPSTVHGKTLLEVGDRHQLWNAAGGFDCGDGWADILDRLFTDLARLGWSGHLHEVREKLGSLRVYLPLRDASRPAIRIRLMEAEAESTVTCEECGRAGRRRGLEGGQMIGRLWTLCDADAALEGYPPT